MRKYRQLTEEERIEIYAMKQAGKEQNNIDSNYCWTSDVLVNVVCFSSLFA